MRLSKLLNRYRRGHGIFCRRRLRRRRQPGKRSGNCVTEMMAANGFVQNWQHPRRLKCFQRF